MRRTRSERSAVAADSSSSRGTRSTTWPAQMSSAAAAPLRPPANSAGRTTEVHPRATAHLAAHVIAF